jgi:hypothetical protein
MTVKGPDQEVYQEDEGSQGYAVTLERIIATPPDHMRNVKFEASPKKRGRPPKKDIANDNQ